MEDNNILAVVLAVENQRDLVRIKTRQNLVIKHC